MNWWKSIAVTLGLMGAIYAVAPIHKAREVVSTASLPTTASPYRYSEPAPRPVTTTPITVQAAKPADPLPAGRSLPAASGPCARDPIACLLAAPTQTGSTQPAPRREAYDPVVTGSVPAHLRDKTRAAPAEGARRN